MISLFIAAQIAAPVAIENVRVEVGDGTVLERATVVFDGGKIRSVGKKPAPKGAERIDGTGRTLSPGFIETLTQLGLTEVRGESQTNDYRVDRGALAPAFRAADGFNAASVRIPIGRQGGVTSAITSATGAVLSGTGTWFHLTGRLADMPDPGQAAAMFGSINAQTAEKFGGSRGGLWLMLRRAFDDARFFRKNRSGYDRGQAPPLSLGRTDLEALFPVIDRRIPLVLYTHRASDIAAAMKFASEQEIRLVVAGGEEAWMLAARLAKNDVPVIFKPTDQVPWSFDALQARDDAAAVLGAAGVDVIISAYEWSQNVRRVRQEAGIAVAYGLAHSEAIRAITSTPARVFGRTDLGLVAVGKRADLVLWTGDPLEISSVAESIWIGGERQSTSNRQLELVNRYRTPTGTVR